MTIDGGDGAIRFTPREPPSLRSAINVERVRILIETSCATHADDLVREQDMPVYK
jgi:hypothetical protein